MRKKLEAELSRLEKNKERREQRNISKNIQAGSIPGTPISAGAVTSTGKPIGTQRKCANCGRVGHIKTNKKLCPLLNGEMVPDQNDFNNAAFASPTAAMSSFMSPPGSTPTADTTGFF